MAQLPTLRTSSEQDSMQCAMLFVDPRATLPANFLAPDLFDVEQPCEHRFLQHQSHKASFMPSTIPIAAPEAPNATANLF